jgi:hypothetical protein
MIGCTLPEIRRLLVSLIQRHALDHETVWSWSRWRRRRQYQARQCHYRHRGYLLTQGSPKVPGPREAAA